MKNYKPRQLELFADGSRRRCPKRPMPPRPTEAHLQAKLDAARIRLHEIVIRRMKARLPAETRSKLREAEAWRRGEVRLHFQALERLHEDRRQRRADRGAR
jgi:hypothetical protein